MMEGEEGKGLAIFLTEIGLRHKNCRVFNHKDYTKNCIISAEESRAHMTSVVVQTAFFFFLKKVNLKAVFSPLISNKVQS